MACKDFTDGRLSYILVIKIQSFFPPSVFTLLEDQFLEIIKYVVLYSIHYTHIVSQHLIVMYMKFICNFKIRSFHTVQQIRDQAFLSQTTGLRNEHGISVHTPPYPVDDVIHFSEPRPVLSFGSPVNQLVQVDGV